MWSPSTARRPTISAMSPVGVDVACALTCTMSAAGQAGVAQRQPDRARAAGTLRVAAARCRSRPRSCRRRPAARRPGRRGRPRGRPVRARSRRRPRRARSRPGPCPTDARRAPDRRCGSTSRASTAKPAIGSGWMTASVPPATTTSARPDRMMSSAQAIASAPVAQALAGECTPALAPSSRPTQAAGPFGISIGTVCGLTRRGPDASRMSSWLSRVCAPPMPLPTTTASRSGSEAGRRPGRSRPTPGARRSARPPRTGPAGAA